MKNKILNFTILFLLLLIALPFFAYGDDIAITSIRVTYLDDKTNPEKPITREFKGISDGTYWSKPHKINVEIEIVNNGKKSVKKVRFSGGLFVLINDKIYDDKIDFPSINDSKHHELRDVSDDPVWVWNRTYPFSPLIKILEPGEKRKITFKDIDIWNEYYPFGYSIKAYAIKVKAFGKHGRGKDETPKDNFIDFIYSNGD